ncbi:MAG: hypothetical protein KDB26_05245 [Microthrixaceae bacterium]|nr:hypothetical protein [Microthrixaceae bacterium]
MTDHTAAVADALAAFEQAERDFNRVIETADPRLMRDAAAKLKETHRTYKLLREV